MVEDFKKIKSYDTKEQIQFLVNLAFEKGLKKAIKIAKDLNSAYVIDAFHDLIVDRLYNELKRRGKDKF